ncbi:Hypothetical predicted protein [Cloeon dipterum]|uniref:MATH domain-containing protein n=1 Tax=Cloeon dipterum TaxID=197152 RepID=A0A8S1CFU0_9INSE|nr:Hypothetical predicted protein [Cloeon dipterum]
MLHLIRQFVKLMQQKAKNSVARVLKGIYCFGSTSGVAKNDTFDPCPRIPHFASGPVSISTNEQVIRFCSDVTIGMKLLVLALFGFFWAVFGGAVPAPDDSEATILPPSLLYARGSGGRSNGSGASDAQCDNPMCQVDADDLVNTAKNAVARVLKSICCGSKEPLQNSLDDRIFNLESQFADQINVIKTILLNMEERIGEVDSSVKKLRSDLRNETPRITLDGVVLSGVTNNDELKRSASETRESEVQLYNSSIYMSPTPTDLKNKTSEQQVRIFTYFWRIRDMSNKLRNWEPRRSIRSPSFFIAPSSYKMYMRMFPRHNNGKNVYLHVGLTKGEFDNTLSWPFKLKMRLSVLDQRTVSEQDINSRVWDPTLLCSEFNWRRPTGNGDNHECVGLGFPQEVLTTRDYLTKNAMIVKLTVYLDL